MAELFDRSGDVPNWNDNDVNPEYLDTARDWMRRESIKSEALGRKQSSTTREVEAAWEGLKGNIADVVGTTADRLGATGVAESAASYRKDREAEAEGLVGGSTYVQSWDDVKTPADFVSFAAKMGLGSIPDMALVVGGGLGGGALLGARVAARLGTSAARGQAIAAGGSGWAAGLPSQVGEALSGQRQQTDDEEGTNLGAAALAGGVASAFNLLGPEGTLLKAGPAAGLGRLGGTGTTMAGRAARGAAAGAVAEGATEAVQQALVESARYGVDSQFDILNEGSLKRIKESAIGGAVLGGGVGSVAVRPPKGGAQDAAQTDVPPTGEDGKTPGTEVALRTQSTEPTPLRPAGDPDTRPFAVRDRPIAGQEPGLKLLESDKYARPDESTALPQLTSEVVSNTPRALSEQEITAEIRGSQPLTKDVRQLVTAVREAAKTGDLNAAEQVIAAMEARPSTWLSANPDVIGRARRFLTTLKEDIATTPEASEYASKMFDVVEGNIVPKNAGTDISKYVAPKTTEGQRIFREMGALLQQMNVDQAMRHLIANMEVVTKRKGRSKAEQAERAETLAEIERMADVVDDYKIAAQRLDQATAPAPAPAAEAPAPALALPDRAELQANTNIAAAQEQAVAQAGQPDPALQQQAAAESAMLQGQQTREGLLNEVMTNPKNSGNRLGAYISALKKAGFKNADAFPSAEETARIRQAATAEGAFDPEVQAQEQKAAVQAEKDRLDIEKKRQSLQQQQQMFEQRSVIERGKQNKQQMEQDKRQAELTQATAPAGTPAPEQMSEFTELSAALRESAEAYRELMQTVGPNMSTLTGSQYAKGARETKPGVAQKLLKRIEAAEAAAKAAEKKAAEAAQEVQARREARKAAERAATAPKTEGPPAAPAPAATPALESLVSSTLADLKKQVDDLTKKLEEKPVTENVPKQTVRRPMAQVMKEDEMLVADVTKTVREAMVGWRNPPEVMVVNPFANPRNAIEKLAQDNFTPTTGGLYIQSNPALGRSKPVIIVFAKPGLHPIDVRGTLFHEALGHYGLREAYGRELVNNLRQIYASNREFRAAVDQRMKERAADSEGADPLLYHAEEEIVSRFEALGATLPPPGILTRIAKWLGSFLRFRYGWYKTNWTNADIAAMLRAAQDAVVNDRGQVGTGARDADTMRRTMDSQYNARQAAGVPERFPARNVRAGATSNADTRTVADKAVDGMKKIPGIGATPQAQEFAANAAQMKESGLMALMFGHDFVDYISKFGLDASNYHRIQQEMQSSINESTRKLDTIINDIATSAHKDRVNKALFDITKAGKWGYKPSWKPDAVIDKDAEAYFNSLPEPAQRMTKQVFEYFHNTRQDLQTAIEKYIAGVEKDELAEARAQNFSQKELDEIRDRRRKSLKLFNEKVPMMEGPYAPLSRFGEFVAVAKSKEFMDLEALIKSAGKATPADRTKFDAMRSDPKHYAVSFTETLGEARTAAAAFKEKNPSFEIFDAYPRMTFQDQVGLPPFLQMQKIMEGVDEEVRGGEIEQNAARQLQRMLKDLYISTLAETSARKYDLRRANVNGASDDMLRAVVTKGRADAHFLSQMTNRHELNTEMKRLIDESNEEQHPQREDRRRAINELVARHTSAMKQDPSSWQDKATMVSALWFLATSPKYYIMNGTQPWISTYPMLAGRFGGGAAAGAMWRASRDITPKLGQIGARLWEGKFNIDDLKAVTTDGERDMLKTAQKQSILDMGQQYDAGYWDSTSKLGVFAGQIMHKFRTMSSGVELINRYTAGVAAYRLNFEKTKDHAAAQEYALKVIQQTQFDYGRMNAPSALTMLPKVMSQFKKYQFGQVALIARLMHGAIQEARGLSKEQGWVMRKTFAYQLGTITATAGMVGWPAMQIMGVLGSALFGDENEPLNGEKWLDDTFGKGMGKILLKGPLSYFTGVELEALGFGKMLNPLPFVDYTKLDERGGWEAMAAAAGGPVVGLGGQFSRAYGQVMDGNVLQGTISALPNGFGNLFKGLQMATDGYRKPSNGDLLLPADEISGILKAFGFQPSAVADAQKVNGQVMEATKYFQESLARTKKDYIEAVTNSDTAWQQQLIREWQAKNDAKGRFGLKATPVSDLLRAPSAQKQRERNTVKGVQFTPATEKAVRASFD